MNSNLTQYYTDRVEKLYWLNRDRRARRYIEKSERQRETNYTDYVVIALGGVVTLLAALIMR